MRHSILFLRWAACTDASSAGTGMACKPLGRICDTSSLQHPPGCPTPGLCRSTRAKAGRFPFVHSQRWLLCNASMKLAWEPLPIAQFQPQSYSLSVSPLIASRYSLSRAALIWCGPPCESGQNKSDRDLVKYHLQSTSRPRKKACSRLCSLSPLARSLFRSSVM